MPGSLEGGAELRYVISSEGNRIDKLFVYKWVENILSVCSLDCDQLALLLSE